MGGECGRINAMRADNVGLKEARKINKMMCPLTPPYGTVSCGATGIMQAGLEARGPRIAPLVGRHLGKA